MKLKHVFVWLVCLTAFNVARGQTPGQTQFKINQNSGQTYGIEFSMNGEKVLQSPAEGLWSVSTDWQNDWMTSWVHGSPTKQESVNDWEILTGKMLIQGGEMAVRDAYRLEDNGMVHGIRRFEWHGKDTLRKASL